MAGQQFYYNTTVSHVNATNIHNTYTQTVVNNTTVNRVSFNGGTGGVAVRPTAAEQAAARAPHRPATAVQVQHRQAVMASHTRLASDNRDKPQIAATSRPAELNGREVVKASSAGTPEKASRTVVAAKAHNPGANTAAETRAPVHAADLPPVARQAAPTTGNAERDRVNQQAQDNLRVSQEKQRQELQQQQAADHERAAKQPFTVAGAKALELQHQEQTQALAQRHTTEQKTLRVSQAKPPEKKGEAAPHT